MLTAIDSFKFVVALFEHQPLIVDATEIDAVKMAFPSAPKRSKYDEENTMSEKQIAQDAKQVTTVAIFTDSGDHVLSGTKGGWMNVIEVATSQTIYSTKICSGVVIYLRLTSSGRAVVCNAADRVIRTLNIPNLSAADLDPDTIDISVEHKFQDVVNRLSWNHVCFSSTGEYVTASTYNNHDIYIWERNHGSLVKILEGPKEEIGAVEWHPQRPLIAACGMETGRIFIWSNIPQQRWSALAPDFVEVEENVEYIEHEDEFDIHPQEEIHKRRLDLEDEEVDVLTVEPVKGLEEEEGVFHMPVQLDLMDSEGEEQFITIRRGEMRRKSRENSEGTGDEGKRSRKRK